MSDSHAAALPAPGNGHGHSHGASVKTYLIIAVILAVITGLEVGAVYVPAPLWALYTFLGVLSIGKFALVVMFFMHLYYDAPLVTFIFVSSLILASLTLISLKALMNVPSLQASSEWKPKQMVMKAASAERGKEVFATIGCVQCHTIKGVPGATATIGPALDGIGTRAASRLPPMTADQYIIESIKHPSSYLVPGYESAQAMPEFESRMNQQQFLDLVKFLESLD
jgi:cytochrome c oxidase subunit 4